MKENIKQAQTELLKDIDTLLKKFHKDTGMYVKKISQSYVDFQTINSLLPINQGLKIDYILATNILE